MSLTLNVGITRKLGLPNYGSAGASCYLQTESDLLVMHEPETLQVKIRALFDACRRAVDVELARMQPSDPLQLNEPPSGFSAVGEEGVNEPDDCRAARTNSAAPLATERQVEFLYHLTRQIRALTGQRLKLIIEHLYHRPIEELTAVNASRLITLLKEVRSGARSVEDLLPEAAA